MKLPRILFIALLAFPVFAQIRFVTAPKLWILDTGVSTYILGINEQNALQNVYWGDRLYRDADLAPAHTMPEHASFDSRETMTNEEYPGWGGIRFNEPCLKVTLADGTRDLVLTYVSHEIRGDTLEIHTRDIRYALAVDLVYRVYPRYGIIEKHSIIRNQTTQPIVVESAQSGVWYVPAGEGYRLTHLTGRWAGETQLHRNPSNPARRSSRAAAATPATRPIRGLRSMADRPAMPPPRNTAASGSAPSPGAATGSSSSRRPPRSRSASPAVSTISISPTP